jgi:hypothetical protein
MLRRAFYHAFSISLQNESKSIIVGRGELLFEHSSQFCKKAFMMQTIPTSPTSPTKFTLIITSEAPLDRSGLEAMLEALVGQVRRFAQSEWATRIDPNCVASIRSDLPYASPIVSSEEQFYGYSKLY